MKPESQKESKAKTEIFRKIGNQDSKIKTKKSQVTKNKNSSELSTVYLSPIADIAARISPISYLAYLLLPPVVKAQPIKTSTDGTNTIVEKSGNQFNIRGGRLSGDGRNRFHSFSQFNVDKGQIVNFSSTEKIKNIITRVNGGNSSFINGLIKVTGGNSNLYIINPAGIIFGKNAQLNIPASFSATTATGIQFNNQLFSATGKNNYASLIGNPSAFTFPKEPAPIINYGNLEVQPGQNVTLIAGSVVNDGTITAPGGEIRIAAVPDQSMVRISKEGLLLSLEVPKNRFPNSPDGQINALSLPQMLTGEDTRGNATRVTMNQNGQFILTGDETVATTPGSVVISGNIDASNTQHTNRSLPLLTQENTNLVGGNVEILGDRIDLKQANINVSGDGGGGTVSLSNYTVNQKYNNHIHVSADSIISANANFTGQAGNVAIAGEQIDISGHISARGSGNLGKGGSVEISGGGSFSGTVDVSAKNNVGEIRIESENITVKPETNFQVSDVENNQSSNLNISEDSL
ncbi:MAG: filamentous hemagglutinin N-terminal domain-containing protein, partial [Trichodesmium sp.]